MRAIFFFPVGSIKNRDEICACHTCALGVFSSCIYPSLRKMLPLRHKVQNTSLDEFKGFNGNNGEQCATVDSFAGFVTTQEPFFSIGKVIAKGVAEKSKKMI